MKNEIENIFKQKFDSFEAEPSAGLFDAILAKRAKKKKAIWMWSAAALLFSASALFLWSKNSNTNSQLAEQNIEITNQKDAKPVIIKDEQEELSLDVKGTELTTEKSVVDIPNATKKKITSLNTRNIAVNQDIASNNKPKDLLDSEDPASNKWAKLFDQIQKENPAKDPDKATLYYGNKKQIVDKNIALNTKAPATANTEPILAATPQKDDAIANEEEEEEEEEEEATLPLPTGKLVKLSKWRIQPTAGLGYASRSISAAGQEYVDLRNNTESVALSYQAGMNVVYQFSPKWNVQSGIQYSQRNENFDYTKTTYSVEEKEVQRTEIIIHPVLGEIERNYSETVQDTVAQYSANTTSKNTFQSIRIPLVLERQLLTKNDWSLLAKAGLLAGIYSDRSGLLLSSNSDINEYTNIPTRKAGINSMLLGVGVQYAISPRVSILAYPEANLQLNSSTKNAAGFAQKDWGVYTHFGLRIGL